VWSSIDDELEQRGESLRLYRLGKIGLREPDAGAAAVYRRREGARDQAKQRTKGVFGFGAISVVTVSFQILATEWFHSVFGSKNGVVLFFVWFKSLDRTESFYFLFD
jgi:hypothetical protein